VAVSSTAITLLHAARADLESGMGALDAAEQSCLRALGLVGTDSERRLLERRLAQVRLQRGVKNQ